MDKNASLYTMAGELVLRHFGLGGRLEISTRDLPFGIYLVVVEFYDGTVNIDRRIKKLAVVC